jgi:type IV pilus assembly protein PilX
MRLSTVQPRHRQRGATLIIALIFLVILALLGTTVATTNTMQERMASNTRNRDIAFQAAEYVLREAESNLTTGLNLTALAFNGSNGLFLESAMPSGAGHANDNAYWRGYAWTTGTNSRTPATNLAGVPAQPRYVVERLPTIVGTTYYRVTARGTGYNNSVVILQAMYHIP